MNEATNMYQEMGYDSREDYLNSLADDHGVDINIVEELADLLTESELWDGLVTSLQDYSSYHDE